MLSFISIVVISTTFSRLKANIISECLIKKKLFHDKSYSCVSILSDVHCPEGEWVVHGSILGTGVCAPKTECPPGEIPVLALEGGIGCSCPHGKQRREGFCSPLFIKADCSNEEILLPTNLGIGKKICPANFSCKRIEECLSYQLARTEIAKRRTKQRKSQIRYLQELVCQKERRSICCPEKNTRSLLSDEVILASQLPQTAECKKNPCHVGYQPQQNEGKYVRCIKTGEKRRDVVVVKSKWSFLPLLRVVKANCGRSRTWQYGRCVRIFWYDSTKKSGNNVKFLCQYFHFNHGWTLLHDHKNWIYV